MIFIDVIKICDEIAIYSIIVTRFDRDGILSNATLRTSMQDVKARIERQTKDFEAAGRKVTVRYHNC